MVPTAHSETPTDCSRVHGLAEAESGRLHMDPLRPARGTALSLEQCAIGLVGCAGIPLSFGIQGACMPCRRVLTCATRGCRTAAALYIMRCAPMLLRVVAAPWGVVTALMCIGSGVLLALVGLAAAAVRTQTALTPACQLRTRADLRLSVLERSGAGNVGTRPVG